MRTLKLPPYTKFPEIKSGNIVLRQVQLTDMADVMEISFYDGKPASTVEEAIEMQEKIDQDYAHGESIHWAIADKATNEVMGTLGYYRGFENKSGEVGCVLRPKFRGKGLMTSALELAIGFGFETIGLEKVVAVTTRENAKAIVLIGRLGFEQVESADENYIEYHLTR